MPRVITSECLGEPPILRVLIGRSSDTPPSRPRATLFCYRFVSLTVPEIHTQCMQGQYTPLMLEFIVNEPV